MERSVLRNHVREVLLSRLGAADAAPAPRPEDRSTTVGAIPSAARVPVKRGRDLVVEDDVLRARVKGVDVVTTPGAIVTPLARETAARFKVRILESSPEVAPSTETGRTPVGAPSRAEGVSSPAASNPASKPCIPAVQTAFRRVAFAADHGGFPMKQKLRAYAESELGLAVVDLGTHSEAAVDYPDLAHAAAQAVQKGEVDAAVVVDGAGIGSAMAANRRKGVRAATCLTILQALNAREHNDANVLCLGGRHLGEDAAKAVLTTFVRTAFAGGRHQKRVDKIDGGAV